MREYTIDDTTYVAIGDRLFTRRDETHNFDGLDDGEVYLYDEEVVKIYGSFSTAEIVRFDDTDNTRVEHESDFDGATPLDSVLPDDVAACPTDSCDGWAGPKDDPDSQYCFECGYGLDD